MSPPVGADSGDPVAAAREWLLRNGGLPPDEGEDATRRSGADGSLSRTSRPPVRSEPEPDAAAEEDCGVGSERKNRRRPRRGTGGAAADQQADADADADPEAVARTIVLRKLAAQARTRHELAMALTAKEVPVAVADAVLDRMVAVGLVDDAAFARDWVQSRQQRRHLSRSALRRELETKGVERELIDDAVGEVDGGDERQAARDLAERKLRSMGGLPRDVQYRRLAGALARRGFGPGVAAPVIGEVLSDAAG